MSTNSTRGVLPILGDLAKAVVRAALERAVTRLSPHETLLAVDATCGNGHDALFLAQALRDARPAGRSLVLAFDIQAEALAHAHARLETHKLNDGVRLVSAGHEALAEHLPTASAFQAIMYNLGFLPGSDKCVVTRSETTLLSLRAALEHLRPGGVCAVHAYGGHAGGAEELRGVETFFAALPFDAFPVARYAFSNKSRNPEVLFLVEKR